MEQFVLFLYQEVVVFDLVDLIEIPFKTLHVLTVVETMRVEFRMLSEIIQHVLLQKLFVLQLVDVPVVVEILHTLHSELNLPNLKNKENYGFSFN